MLRNQEEVTNANPKLVGKFISTMFISIILCQIHTKNRSEICLIVKKIRQVLANMTLRLITI